MAKPSLPKCYDREVRMPLPERPFRDARFPSPVSPRICSRGTTVSSIRPVFATLSVAWSRRTPKGENRGGENRIWASARASATVV
jgi:hypothetical protein